LNEQYKAKPTTFNGVTYKSKSEARLAACFDAWGWSFSYETVSVGNWKADFTVKDSESVTVIEYKPTKPTSDYLRDLSSNFSKILLAARANPLLKKTSVCCELWCVDFWNNIVDAWRFYENGTSIPLCWIKTYDFSPGKDFRFDLRSSSQTYDYTQMVLERMQRNKNGHSN